MATITTTDIEIRKQLGDFKPNPYLSNLAMMYFEDATLASKRLFPVCPVDVSSGHFFEFSRADLARDGMQRKPDYGKVAPTVLGHSGQSYSCHVDQILLGIDKIVALNYQRAGLPNTTDPYRLRVQTVVEQISTHMENEFAENFFKKGAWSNEWTGAATANAAQKKFLKFDNASSDPVSLIDARIVDIRRVGRRKPNKLALGMDAFVALKNNPAIRERIKYSGTSQNPSVVNEQVLAQIFGLDSVVVLDATHNTAPLGQENMEFICDTKGALLLYAPDTPQIDAPSAGYCFSWRLDGGNYITIDTFEGDRAEHTDFVEGLVAFDFRKTADCLGVYFADCCG